MSDKIKILHIVPAIYEGGVGSVVNNYYRKIDKSKFSFDVITHLEETNKGNNILYNNSKVLYFKTIGEVGLLGYYKQVKTKVNISEYDIIHIHTGHITGLYAVVYRLCGAKKIISHAHTTTAPNPNHTKFMPFFRILTRAFSSKLLSCGNLAGLFCFGSTDFKIIRNGLDYSRYKNIDDKKILEIRQNLGFCSSDIIMGNVAAFIELKNHEFLLQVFLALYKVKKNVKLVLVGEGPLKAKCSEFVNRHNLSDKVFFLGQRNDIYQLMKVFDVFLLPSLFEGLPVSGIEAQAAGTKCVFSNTIDSQLDLGAGLAKFLPINKGVLPWVEYLRNIETTKIANHVVKDALISNGYEINHSILELENLYFQLANHIHI